jgi:hypothetical protein
VLVRLAYAVHVDDAATLAQDVDWTRVRQGLKDDLADRPQVIEAASRTPDPDALPEFGDSFADTVVASGVDADVTPTHICALMHDTAESMGAAGGSATTGVLGALHGAFFTGLDSFEASVNTATGGRDGLLKVRLERTRGLSWAVTRVWVPPALLAGGDAAQLHRS